MEREFKPGDKVFYPVVNRVMTVKEVLEDGKIRCVQFDVLGQEDPCGDYEPYQIKHCTDQEEMDLLFSEKNTSPPIWETVLGVIGAILAFLFVVFIQWLLIQEDGGFDAWRHNTDGRFTDILLFIARLVR